MTCCLLRLHFTQTLAMHVLLCKYWNKVKHGWVNICVHLYLYTSYIPLFLHFWFYYIYYTQKFVHMIVNILSSTFSKTLISHSCCIILTYISQILSESPASLLISSRCKVRVKRHGDHVEGRGPPFFPMDGTDPFSQIDENYGTFGPWPSGINMKCIRIVFPVVNLGYSCTFFRNLLNGCNMHMPCAFRNLSQLKPTTFAGLNSL